MLSRRGVTYDFESSPYVYELFYENNKIEFVFSSKLHYNKFNEKYLTYRDKIAISLSKRFNLNISMSILSDILLYRKIENRGFLIKYNDEVIKWLNIIELDGQMKILKN